MSKLKHRDRIIRVTNADAIVALFVWAHMFEHIDWILTVSKLRHTRAAFICCQSVVSQ